MPRDTTHLTVRIDRPADEVYEYASNPANVPAWAPGLGTSIELVDGAWFIGTGVDRFRVAFAERNPFGVLDHEVTLPSGDVVHVPMRVIPDGDASEVVFTLRRRPQMTNDELERDAGLVQADLDRLKRILEGID